MADRVDLKLLVHRATIRESQLILSKALPADLTEFKSKTRVAILSAARKISKSKSRVCIAVVKANGARPDTKHVRVIQMLPAPLAQRLLPSWVPRNGSYTRCEAFTFLLASSAKSLGRDLHAHLIAIIHERPATSHWRQRLRALIQAASEIV
jgi:hypothetical protein